jgi:hypothetical protein
MNEIGHEKRRELLEMIASNNNGQEVNYVGFNRFVLRKPKIEKAISGEEIFIYEDILFDDNGNRIHLSNVYNSIFAFRCGIAVVCMRDGFNIVHGRSYMVSKYGLISAKGIELLSCEYDSINVSIDVCIEISKSEKKKFTYVKNIIDGSFDWERAIEV